MPVDTKYLLEAKEKVDEALAFADSGLYNEDKVNEALVKAGAEACKALTRLKDDAEYWTQFTKPTKHPVFVALTEIVKKSHFKDIVLPVCARVLRRLGYKPPEDAERLVEEARKACEGLNANTYNLAERATEARRLVGELAGHTCRLAREGIKSA